MSVLNFSDGIPEQNHPGRIIYPETLLDKKCGGCVRCEKRDIGSKGGWHCCMQKYDIDITPDDKACVNWWDKAEQERMDREHDEAVEKRREELWAIYAPRKPINLPIVFDGYGHIPQCPICGEMPYSTEQCHWCGQRFIQDKEIEEYTKPLTESFTCPNCGADGLAYIAKYNGHRHFHCEKCGCSILE